MSGWMLYNMVYEAYMIKESGILADVRLLIPNSRGD